MSKKSGEDSFFGEKKHKSSILGIKFFSKKKKSKGDKSGYDAGEEILLSEDSTEKGKIYRACLDQDINKLEILITSDNVDTPLADGMRFSDLAAGLGNMEMLKIAVKRGSRLNQYNPAKQVPLHYALSSQNIYECVKYILDNGGELNLPFPNGDYPIHKACSESNASVLELFLKHGVGVSELDAVGMTALHKACNNDFLDHVKILLPFCSDLIDNNDNKEAKTPLHIAILSQNVEIMNLLLDYDAKLNIPMKNGKTALDLLMGSPMLREFIKYQLNIYFSDLETRSIKDLVENKRFLDYLKFLRKIDDEFYGCKYNIQGQDQSFETDTVTRSSVVDEKQAIDELLEIDEENIEDVLEFQTVITNAIKTQEVHSHLKDKELIDTIAIYITKYVLNREDLEMLKKIMKCGEVWTIVYAYLKAHITTLYKRTSSRSGPIAKLFTEKFIDTEGNSSKRNKFNRDLLEKKLSSVLGIHELKFESEDDTFQQNPIDNFITWTILTGKLNLTLQFLQQETIMIVPLCIASAGIIRNLHKLFDDKQFEGVDLVNLALKCETFACNIIKKTLQFDVSENKAVTYQFMLQPLPSFGNINLINLAANCGCNRLMRLQVSQDAMDAAWYKYMIHKGTLWRELVILLGIIPFNPLLWIALYERNKSKRVTRRSNFAIMEKEEDYGSKQSFAFDDRNSITPEITVMEGSQIDIRQRKRKFDLFFKAWKQYYLFYQIPAVKFHYFALSQIVLTVLLSYILLINFSYNITLLEIFVYATTLGFIVEEIKEIATAVINKDHISYLSNKWNVIDVSICILMMAGFTLRIVCMYYKEADHDTFPHVFEDRTWYIARFCLSLACMCMWVKLLQISRVHIFFGPKLKMIYRMIMTDLIPFLYILFIYIMGFGLLLFSLLYPNGYYAYNPRRQSPSDILRHIMNLCFYSIFGEYHLDSLTGGEECSNVYTNKNNNTLECPHPDSIYVVPYLFLPIYIIITTILLLSLIVAMFSKTIEEVDSNSKEVWQFERFEIISEYENCSALPPPFNFLDMLRLLGIRCLKTRFPRIQESMKFDSYNQDSLAKYLINQAMALRNSRQTLMNESVKEVHRGNHQAHMSEFQDG